MILLRVDEFCLEFKSFWKHCEIVSLLFRTYHQRLMCWRRIQLLCFAFFFVTIDAFMTYGPYILSEKCARTFIVLYCRSVFEWERAPERTLFSKSCLSSKFAICSVERVRRDVRASRALNEWAYFFGARTPRLADSTTNLLCLVRARFYAGWWLWLSRS